MKNKIIGLLLPIIAAFVVIWILFNFWYSIDESYCSAINKFEILEWNGKVTNKYIDKKEHNYKIVVFDYEEFGKKKQKTHRSIAFNQNENYTKIEVGDSIIKKSGNKFVILKRNEVVTKLLIDTICQD